MVWFMVGMIGAGSMVALGAHRATTPSGLLAQRAAQMRRWWRKRREIRLLQRWYTSAEASTGSRARRRVARVALGMGPLAAAAAVGVLTAVAVGAGAHAPTALLLAGVVIVGFAAGWRTSAALALAANALGLLTLVVSRIAPAPRPDRFAVVATLAGLAALVGISAIAHALRQPPRLVDLAPGPTTIGPAEAGDELGRAA